MKFTTKQLFLLHILIWTVLELLVNPIGNFPLNDDWAYYQNVYYLAEEGRFFFSDWLAMTLVLQVLWGAFVCKIFGFSFTVLRLATVLLAVVGTWSGFLFFNKFCKNKTVAYLAALLLLINPLYFSLANSFMTEVHFLVAFIPGLYCFTQYLDTNQPGQNKYWWGGMLFSMMATMVRQPGLMLPLAFAMVYLWRHRTAIQVRSLITGVAPLVLTFLLYKLYSYWLLSTQVEMPVYGEIGLLFEALWDGSLPFKVMSRNSDFLFYCGWFLLPLTLYVAKYYWNITTQIQKATAGFLSLILASSFALKFHLFPMGNMIGNLWLGPKTLYKEQGHEDLSELMMSEQSWLLMKWIGCLAGILMVFLLMLALFRHYKEKRWSVLLLLVITFGYYAFLILNPYYIDRYVLIFIPLFIPILLPRDVSFRVPLLWKMGSVLSFVVLLFYSVSGTHDYLSWNRTAWQVSENLENERHISPKKIKGGFEYTCWHDNPTFLDEPTNLSKDTSTFAVSFEPFLCGWEMESEHPYFSWSFMKNSSIYLHKKQIFNRSDSILTSDVESINAEGDLLTSDSTIVLLNRAPRDSSHSLSGKYSIRLDKKKRYSFTLEMERTSPCYEITARVWRKREEGSDLQKVKVPSVLVVEAGGYFDKLSTRFNFHKNRITDRRPNGWEQIECQVQLYGHTDAEKVKVYLWNNSGERQWFDDFECVVR